MALNGEACHGINNFLSSSGGIVVYEALPVRSRSCTWNLCAPFVFGSVKVHLTALNKLIIRDYQLLCLSSRVFL